MSIRQSYLIFASLLGAIIVSWIMHSCGGNSKKTASEINHIEVPTIKIERFDLDFDHLTPDNAADKHVQWKTTYGEFYIDFIEQILRIGNIDQDIQVVERLKEIAASPDFRALGDSVQVTFPDLTRYEVHLTDAFKRIKFHFPERWHDEQLPRFISFFSGFALQTSLGEDYMGIGLDLFLGSDSPFYPAIVQQFPRYLSHHFTPDNVVPRVIEHYMTQELLPSEPTDARFIDHMLHAGKRLYLLDLILPDVPDRAKIGYTENQLSWARHFEKGIWKWFMDEELLYSSHQNDLRNYFGEGPFTIGLGERNESAPKLGAYIGWQMVRKYIERHPQCTPEELLNLSDAQLVLEASKYQPR